MIRKNFSFLLISWLFLLSTACSGQSQQGAQPGQDSPAVASGTDSPKKLTTSTPKVTLTATLTQTPTITPTSTITNTPTITPTPPPAQELLFFITIPAGLESERCADIHQYLYSWYTAALNKAVNLPPGITNFYITSNYSELPAGMSVKDSLIDQKQCFSFSADVHPGIYYVRYHADINLDEATASNRSIKNPAAQVEGYFPVRILPMMTDHNQVVAAIGRDLGVDNYTTWQVHLYSSDGNQLSMFGRSVKEFTLSMDGKYLAAVEDGGRLFVWDTVTGERANYPTPKPNEFVESPQWLPDGSGLLYLVRGELTLSRFDEVRVEHIASLPGIRSFRISPDGKNIAYQGDKKLSLMHVDGTAAQVMSGVAGEIRTFKWSPDGSKIGIVYSMDNKLNILDVETQEISVIDLGEEKISFFTQTIRIDDFSWSPDGNTVVFSTSSAQILANVDGSNQHKLLEEDCYNPVWSPDGTWILFRCWGVRGIHHSQHLQLYRIHPDGTGLQAFAVDDMREYEAPQWIGLP